MNETINPQETIKHISEKRDSKHRSQKACASFLSHLCHDNVLYVQHVILLCDFMQTFPSFIYLIPVIMLFKVSDISAIIAVTVVAVAISAGPAALSTRAALSARV